MPVDSGFRGQIAEHQSPWMHRAMGHFPLLGISQNYFCPLCDHLQDVRPKFNLLTSRSTVNNRAIVYI